METDDETINHLERELSTLKKFVQKIQVELIETQRRFTAEELFEFFHERMHYLVNTYYFSISFHPLDRSRKHWTKELVLVTVRMINRISHLVVETSKICSSPFQYRRCRTVNSKSSSNR